MPHPSADTTQEISLLRTFAHASGKAVWLLRANADVLFFSENTPTCWEKEAEPFVPTSLIFGSPMTALDALDVAKQAATAVQGTFTSETHAYSFEGTVSRSPLSANYWLVMSPKKNPTDDLLFYQKLLDNTSDVIAYYNENEELVYVSPSVLQLTGYTAEEVKNLPPFALTHPDERENLQKKIAEDIASGAPVYRFTYRSRHKDGHYVWVDAVSRRNYFPDGRLKEEVLGYRSIQETMQITADLRASEERYKHLVGQSPFGVVIHHEGEVLYANRAAAKLLKYAEDGVVGINIFQVIPPDSLPEVSKRVAQLKMGHVVPLRHEQLIRANGERMDVEVMASPVQFRQKACIQSVFWDITQRKQVEKLLKEQQQELEKTRRELDKFLYSTAHDLRSPIASSLGLLYLCEQEEASAEVQQYLQLLRESIEKLDRFIHDIGDLASNLQSEIRIAQTDPQQCTAKAFQSYLPTDGKFTIEIENEWELTSPFYTNTTRFQVILNNLISNAIRFKRSSQETMYVRVKGTVDSTHCTFSVDDNGLGIAAEHIPKIFDIFYRAHDTKAGAGLGLYLVRETVQKLGGDIQVSSDTRQGSRFTVTLPNEWSAHVKN